MTETKREQYAELARLRFDAELAIEKAAKFAQENDLEFRFEATPHINAGRERGGWTNSSKYC